MQRELPRGITVQAGYVGARTRDLILGTGAININQLASEYLSPGSALLQSVANPFYGKGGAGVVASSTITRAQLLRPFPEVGAVNKTLSSRNHAKYDSLVVKAQKRLSAGVTFLTSWTFSKNMDNSFGATNYYTTSSTTPQNSYDLDSEYGLAIVNTPHSVKGAVSYELPFGRAKPFLHDSRWMDEIVGGWQVNAVTLLQSGFRVALTQNTNLNSRSARRYSVPTRRASIPGRLAAWKAA